MGITTLASAKSVYLNGKDISSARRQALKRVDVRIDEVGNVFIEGPQYQVMEEKTYSPLQSKPELPVSKPEHRPPGQLPDRIAKQLDSEQTPLEKSKDPLQNGEVVTPKP